jgi:hypothetical protein
MFFQCPYDIFLSVRCTYEERIAQRKGSKVLESVQMQVQYTLETLLEKGLGIIRHAYHVGMDWSFLNPRCLRDILSRSGTVWYGMAGMVYFTVYRILTDGQLAVFSQEVESHLYDYMARGTSRCVWEGLKAPTMGRLLACVCVHIFLPFTNL